MNGVPVTTTAMPIQPTNASPRQAAGATTGQLHMWIGPMFSGKSTALQQHAHTASAAKYRVLVVQHARDNRYDEQKHMTHTGQSYPSIRVSTISHVLDLDDYATSDVVLIDEAQFFDDLHLVHDTMVQRHRKCVFVFGLDGDKHQKPFRHVTDLIAKAESCTKIRAVCAACARQRRATPRAVSNMHGMTSLDNAPFSVYLGKEQARFVVGATEYEARCRFHLV